MSVLAKVFVLNQRGQPLMPTSPRGARVLLKTNKAKVKTHNPFTIQLQHATGETKQPITLGIDPGYKNIGFSVITKKEELISGEVRIDQKVSERVQLRREFREFRRKRLWYRPSRFNNRKRKEGWLPPSVEHKVQTHKNLIKKLRALLPITQINVEVSKFDTQKIENLNIKGVEYQQSTLQGYEIKEYLLEKFQRKCAYCAKSNLPLQVEHITPRSRGGTNRISNLTIACHDCNQKKDSQTAEEFGYPEIQAQTKRSLKASTQMNAIVKRLLKDSEVNLISISAYEVKFKRKQINLEKSHANDAFVISGGITQVRSGAYQVKQTRRNNRKLQQNRKRYGISIRKGRYQIQSNDLVLRDQSFYRVKSTCGTKGLILKGLEKPFFSSFSKTIFICSGKTLTFEFGHVV